MSDAGGGWVALVALLVSAASVTCGCSTIATEPNVKRSDVSPTSAESQHSSDGVGAASPTERSSLEPRSTSQDEGSRPNGDTSAALIDGSDSSGASTRLEPRSTRQDEEGSAPSGNTSAALAETSDSSGIAQQLSAAIDQQVAVFTDDLVAYNGRFPMMDIFAGMAGESAPWGSLRVAVVPPSDTVIVRGEYGCGPNTPSFIMLIGDSGVYDTTTVDAPCKIVVESAGTQTGELFSGTFEATVYTTDGARSRKLEHGTFAGIVP